METLFLQWIETYMHDVMTLMFALVFLFIGFRFGRIGQNVAPQSVIERIVEKRPKNEEPLEYDDPWNEAMEEPEERESTMDG